jgi:ketosteroid isomerase-like protein
MTAEQIRTEVGRFWSLFTSKNAEGLEEFYAHESTVFGSGATRPEPGRLAATRRKREYFHPATSVKINLGPIDVMIVGEVGVASYTFTLHATKVSGALGKAVNEDIEHGRATQVFAPDADGKLRIMHEHLSVATRG